MIISFRKPCCRVMKYKSSKWPLILQCGITLYSKYKNEIRIRKLDKWRGIYVVLLLLLLLLLSYQRKINIERKYFFVKWYDLSESVETPKPPPNHRKPHLNHPKPRPKYL